MYIVKPSAQIVFENVDAYSKIENIGRVCYKSEDLINSKSYMRFITNIIKRGHESVIEHHNFVCKVSNELYFKIKELNPKFLNMTNCVDTVTGNIRYIISGSARGFKELWKRTQPHPANLHLWVLLMFLKDRYPLLFNDISNLTPKKVSSSYVEKLLNDAEIRKLSYEERKKHHYVSVKFICDRGCCYDKETKILTKKGWKYFNDLTEDDEYYTLDDNDNITYSKANNIIKKPFKGNLDLWESTRVDLAVTPNHNLWVYDYHKRSIESKIWKFIKSSDANNQRYKFKISSNPISTKGSDVFELASTKRPHGFYEKVYPNVIFNKPNEFFELLGWWVTDGCISKGTNGSGNRLVITQVKSDNVIRINDLLESLEIPHTYYSECNEFRIKLPQLYTFIKDNFIKDENYKKSSYIRVPRWFYTELSHDNINAFIKGVIGGNGTKNTDGHGYCITSGCKGFAEDLVELCLLVGKSGRVKINPPRERKFSNQDKISKCKENYSIFIIDQCEHLFDTRTAKKSTIPYDDYVYCVELPKYHRLYVMRNGKACWCGNSHEAVRHRVASYSQESTRYVNYSKGKYDSNITMIDPLFYSKGLKRFIWWFSSKVSEICYMILTKWLKSTPQEARSVLNNSLKTELIMTTNIENWEHFFFLRNSKGAHPQMVEVAEMIENEFVKKDYINKGEQS